MKSSNAVERVIQWNLAEKKSQRQIEELRKNCKPYKNEKRKKIVSWSVYNE